MPKARQRPPVKQPTSPELLEELLRFTRLSSIPRMPLLFARIGRAWSIG